MREAQEHITSGGSTFETYKGYQQQTPWVGIANTNQKLMLQAASEFGLTPSSRSRIVAGNGKAKETVDEMGHYLGIVVSFLYGRDLTDMQNHVLPYLQSFCSLKEKGVKERREQQVAEKNESREAVPRAGVEINTAVKDAGKAERKAVAQKKEMPGKEKKPSIHERLEINKRIIQEKQGKDKPERGADLGVRTV